jgi:hypothetical protein
MLAPDVNVTKHFFFFIADGNKQATVFAPGREYEWEGFSTVGLLSKLAHFIILLER